MSDLIDRESQLQEQIKAEREILKLDEKIQKLEENVDQKEESLEASQEPKGYMNEETYLKKHGSLDGFKSKEKFDSDGSFFKKIEAQNRKIDELLEFNRQALEHSKKVEKASYEKALRDLQLQKLELIKQADTEGFLALERQAEATKLQLESLDKPVNTIPVVSNEVRVFQEKNSSWLSGTETEDKKMQAVAKSVIVYLQDVEPNISEADAVKRIEQELKEKFPNRFDNENREKPKLVTSSSTDGGDSRGKLSLRLTSQQKDFVRKAKQYGSSLTEEEYAKQLELTGALRNE